MKSRFFLRLTIHTPCMIERIDRIHFPSAFRDIHSKPMNADSPNPATKILAKPPEVQEHLVSPPVLRTRHFWMDRSQCEVITLRSDARRTRL